MWCLNNANRRQAVVDQQGVGLVEILVAVLLISVGLLSLLSFQLLSLQADRSAYFRTQALLIGMDASERIRANKRGFETGSYGSTTPAETKSCYSLGVCTGIELARFEVAELSERAQRKLPGGALKVCIDSTPNDGVPSAEGCDNKGEALAIKVWWDEDQDGIAETRVAMGVALR